MQNILSVPVPTAPQDPVPSAAPTLPQRSHLRAAGMVEALGAWAPGGHPAQRDEGPPCPIP